MLPHAECVHCETILQYRNASNKHYREVHNGAWKIIVPSIYQQHGKRFKDDQDSINTHIMLESNFPWGH